jgi:two-component system, cell cycle response regulator DivK
MTPSAAARKRDDEPSPRQPNVPRSARPRPRDAARAGARRSGVVLLAEDTRDTRELYAFYLDLQGFTVHTVDNGLAAVEAASRLQPDVIVMDQAMPQLDGTTATRRLKAQMRTRAIPVILLTGYPQQEIERGALEAGVGTFLTKPCLPEELEGHVRRAMEGKRRG